MGTIDQVFYQRGRTEDVCWTTRDKEKYINARIGLRELDDLFIYSSVFTGYVLGVQYMLGIRLMGKRTMVLVLLVP